MKITFLISTCVGRDNIYYQCRERFLSLWTFVYKAILKIYHMWGRRGAFKCMYMYMPTVAYMRHIGCCFGEVVIIGTGSHFVFISF